MMLRQILMNQTQAVGKRFEDGKYRYLYFYPTYYFTPETNKFLQKGIQRYCPNSLRYQYPQPFYQ
jgi:CRISPR-associated protein Csc3